MTLVQQAAKQLIAENTSPTPSPVMDTVMAVLAVTQFIMGHVLMLSLLKRVGIVQAAGRKGELIVPNSSGAMVTFVITYALMMTYLFIFLFKVWR